MNVPFALYLAAIATLPLSYAVKFMAGFPDVTWVDPALVLAAAALLLDVLGRPVRGGIRKVDAVMMVGGLFAGFYVSSGLVNGLFGETPPSLEVFREPARLLLVIAVALATRRFAEDIARRRKIYHTLGIVMLVEVAVAVYLLLVPTFGAPAPPSVREYAGAYLTRQMFWAAPVPLPRLGGTFFEAPQFGLFMLSGLFAMYLFHRESGSRSALVYASAGLIGVLGSLSTQVILGLGAALGVLTAKHVAAARRPVVVGSLAIVALSMSLVVGTQISQRLRAERSAGIAGQSIGERTYHTRYAMELVSRGPSNFFVGVGPGMYGPAVAHEGRFPPTVTPQVAPAEILAETGVVGSILAVATIVVLIARIGMGTGITGIAIFGGTLVAVSLQSNWKWAGVFFLLGLLLAVKRPTWMAAVEERDRGPEGVVS